MKAWSSIVALAGVYLSMALVTCAQGNVNAIGFELTPAVSGHEQNLTAEIERQLKEFSQKTDNVGNVWVTIGSGAPHRLVATSIDEPGDGVSEITEDGYLREQLMPQAAPNTVFDTLHFAQPVWVMMRGGKEVSGVFAGLSVHLEPGRLNAPKMNHAEELYVDIGAANASEARAVGVDVLDPIALQRKSFMVGDAGLAGPPAGGRNGGKVVLRLCW